MQTLTYTIGKDRRTLVKDIQNFHIDFKSSEFNWVQARQYENAMRQVFVNVKNDDGTPFDLTGSNIWFEGVLPDKTHKILDAKHAVLLDPAAGQFRFDLPAQAFAVAGSYVQAFFRIVRDGNSITTLEFSLEVLADKVISGLIPRDYITPFEDLYDQLQEILNNSGSKLQAKIDEWDSNFKDTIANLEQLGSETKNWLSIAKGRLEALEEKIRENDVFTKKEADDFKNSINDNINSTTENFKNEINSIINDFQNEDATLYSEATVASEDAWIGGMLPDYMRSNWEGVTNSLDYGDDILNIALITDNHYQEEGNFAYRSDMHYAWFGEASKKANVDLIISNGDNINADNYDLVDASWQKKSIIRQTETAVSILEGSKKATTPVFWIKGNHDTGAGEYHLGVEGPASSLSEDELKRLYRTKTCRFGEVRDGDSLYFYKDFLSQKIRVIGLNTLDDTDGINSDGSWKDKDINNHKLRQQQLDWLANKALKLPGNEWQVIFFFHTPLDGAFGVNNGMKNSGALRTIIETFKNGSSIHIDAGGDFPLNLNVDFSSQGPGTVIAIFNGHYHRDSYDNSFAGINMIEQNASMSFNRQSDNNTSNEDAWDLVSIDTKNRRIKMCRFGKGTNQFYTY